MPAKRKPSRRTTRSTPAKRAAAKRAAPKRATSKRPAPKRAPARKPAAPKRAAPKRPAPKRPAPKRAPPRRSPPKRATPKRATPKRATRRTPGRRDTARALRARGRETSETIVPPAPEPELRSDVEAWPDEPGFPPPLVRGEIATAGPATAAAPIPAWGEEVPAAERRRTKDVYGEDIPIAMVALILAASAFLPWYKGESGLDVTVTAWSTGTWGPIIFFLGLGSFLLVVLRRTGVRLSLPFDEALLHEFGGWLALAGGVIKSRYRPGGQGLLGVSWGLWVGLGAAFLLAFLAGRMAPHAPLVRRPRWYREKGGIIAAVVLLAMIAGAAVFGTINEMAPLGFTGGDTGDLPGLVRGRLPDCAGDFPLPASVKPIQGAEQPCRADFQSDRPAAEVATAMKDTLQRAGWTVAIGETGSITTLTLTEPKCATVAVVAADPGSLVVVAFGVCTTPSPTPT